MVIYLIYNNIKLIKMAYLQCDKCGKSTSTQGSWDTPITILCEECSNKGKIVKVGDTFKSYRPLQGTKIHKCLRIKKSENGADKEFDGWLVDETGIMINPTDVIEVFN